MITLATPARVRKPRIHIVVADGQPPRLVKAISASAARTHVTKHIVVKPATPEDMELAFEAGASVEHVEEPAA